MNTKPQQSAIAVYTRHVPPESNTWQEGAALLVDKPLEWTSFDVVRKLRNHFRIRKIGHAGTLDPLATGLLILCTGKLTKRISHFQGLPKTYEGTLVVGKTTPSYDLETPFEREKPWAHLTPTIVQQALPQFIGTIQQRPPIYAALKQHGKRLYTHARKNRQVTIPLREVYIHALSLTQIALPHIHFRMQCSKGTYVRSFVHDFGQALGTGAYLSALRRTHIGTHTVADAYALTMLTTAE